MAQPTISAVHAVDVPLTNLSVAYMQRAENFVAGRVFPRVPVSKISDRYYTYDRSFWFRSDAQRRPPGTAAARGGYGISTDTYTCERWAIAKNVDDPTRANADAAIDLDREAAEWVASQLVLKAELEWASAYFNASAGWQAGSAAIAWSDAASDPIKDLFVAKRAMLENTGQQANTLVLGAKVFDDLSLHPDLMDRIKYTAGPGNPAMVTEQTLAALFGVSRILVARGVKNTGTEGGTASYDFIASERSALLVHAAPSPGLMTPSAGYAFAWTGLGGNDFGLYTKRFRNELEESDVVEGNMNMDFKQVAADLGYYFSNVVAA